MYKLITLISSLSELQLLPAHQCTCRKCLYLRFEVWLFQVCLAAIVGSWDCLWFKHGALPPSGDTESGVFLSCLHNLAVRPTTTKRSHALQQTVTQDTSSHCMQKWCPRTTWQCSLHDLKVHSLPVMFIPPLVSVMILTHHFAIYRLHSDFYPHIYIWYAIVDFQSSVPTQREKAAMATIY